MRRHLSILMWLARSSLWKLLLLFLVTACAEAAWFLLALQSSPDAPLEALADGGALALPFAISFLLLCAALGCVGCEIGARQSYTLRRLTVTEKAVFTWQWAYNCGCFLLFWAFQLAVSFGLCTLFTAQAEPSLVSGQTVFLAFHRVALLHALLPLEETFLWVRNAFFVLSLGVACAALPYRQRRGRTGWEIAAACTVALFAFPAGVGQWEGNAVSVLLMAFLLLECCFCVYGREGETADEGAV